MDNSKSIVSLKDSVFIRGEFLNKINKMKERLSSKYDLRFYAFDAETKQDGKVDFLGKETDFTELFQEIENNYSNRNLGAILMMSDGLFNKGSNPIYYSNKFKFPIYSIALGDTSPVRDNAIKKLDHNQVAYLGNKFPLDVVVSSSKLKGSNVSVVVSKSGRKLAEQKINFDTDFQIKTASFLLDADMPGAQTYVVQISRSEGELTFENNLQKFVIEVIDNREKILVIGNAAHPDLGAIKESIESNRSYEVETALLSDFTKSLTPYSLVFLHSISMSNAGKIFNEINSKNLPYFLITTSTSDNLPGLTYSGVSGKMNEAEPVYNPGFSLFTLSEEFKSYSNDFPAMKCNLGSYTLNANSTSLFEQKIGVVKTENPLLYFTQRGDQKIGVLLAEGLWGWKMREYADRESNKSFNELLSKIVQYLSVKADKSFFRVFSKKIYKENEQVELDAEVYNDSYELITDPEVNLVLTNSNGKIFNYVFSKTSRSYKLNMGNLPCGDYTFSAKVKVKDKLFQKSGAFSVREISVEKSNLVADHNLLFQLSNKTGGSMYYPSELDKLENDLLINNSIKTISYSQKELTDLVNEKWLFFGLIFFATLEWVIRKRNGLI